MYHNAGEEYLSALGSAWARQWGQQPSLWLARDPDVESKMLRDPIIGHAINHRCALVASADWNLNPRDAEDPKSKLACRVGQDLLDHVRGFTESRKLLARAFFHGARYAEIRGAYKTLTLGDGKPRRWWVPQRLVDQNMFRYRVFPLQQSLQSGCCRDQR